jgi:hypothetical protein
MEEFGIKYPQRKKGKMDVYYVVIQDHHDVLTNKKWLELIAEAESAIYLYSNTVFDYWTTHPRNPTRKTAWVFEIRADWVENIRVRLRELVSDFDQDNILMTKLEDNPELIRPA